MNGRPMNRVTGAERVLARVQVALQAAGTAAGGHVFRGRVDPHSILELPSVNVRRSNGLVGDYGAGVDMLTQEFDMDLLVSGDDWETQADALHAEVHAALAADPELPTLCRGLRFIRSDMRAQAADTVRGTLTVTYQFKALHMQQDITRHPLTS